MNLYQATKEAKRLHTKTGLDYYVVTPDGLAGAWTVVREPTPKMIVWRQIGKKRRFFLDKH